MNLRWNASSWPRRRWAVVIFSVVLITLTPLAWIQWQQVRMLQDVSRNQVDSIMWVAYQLEYELYRLDDALQETSRIPSSTEGADLQERYEVFFSRIELVTGMPRKDLLSGTNAYEEALEAIQAFTTLADPIFERAEALPQDTTTLQQLREQIKDLKPKLSRLTREGNRAVARLVDERNLQLRDQSLIVLVLSSLQAALLVLIVFLLGGYARKQKQENLKLLALSHELEKARDQAEAANHGKSVFLANMSHEIRTPFQGLLGMLDLIGNSPLNQQQKEFLATAQLSANHLLGVLNDILDVTAMDSGMFNLVRSPMSLQQVIRDVKALMGPQAAQRGLQLEVSCDDDVPQWVLGDETRIRQILFNLLSNALKFTEKGQITVSVRRSTSRANGLVMEIQDTGSGMDPLTVAQLFTRFFQADSSQRRRTGGTGLGLEISRNIARMMDGDIHVSSRPGSGSAFTVLLILPPCDAKDTRYASDFLSLDDSDDNATEFPSLHFLVADDHPINTQYLQHLLHSLGHEATLCEDGREALRLAQQQHFDALLLDYHMPGMDGLAITRAIRSGPAPFSSAKILMITADVVNDTRQLAREAGVDAFLSKPLKGRDLQRALLACGLNMSHSAAAGRGSAGRQFVMSDYELPVDPSVSARDAQRSGSDLVDWPAIQEITSVMPKSILERQLQALYQPGSGPLAICLSAVRSSNLAEQRAALHNLKGCLQVLGLDAMAKHCTKAEEQLLSPEKRLLDNMWAERLVELASRTHEELANEFVVPSPIPINAGNG